MHISKKIIFHDVTESHRTDKCSENNHLHRPIFKEIDRYLLVPEAMIALSIVQSFAWILIHNAILFINTSILLGITKPIG